MCLLGMLLMFDGILLTFTGRWILNQLQLVPIIGALAMRSLLVLNSTLYLIGCSSTSVVYVHPFTVCLFRV